MFRYLKFGNVPPMHHIAHYSSSKQLLNEYCFTREGFEDSYSILYLHHPPTQEVESETYLEAAWSDYRKRDPQKLQRRHFQSLRFDSGRDYISGRKVLAFNESLTYGLCHPEIEESAFFANNDADELFFLRDGQIELQSLFGKLSLVAGDYFIIPRSCPYRFSGSKQARMIFVEAREGVGIPSEFINDRGQFKMDAPYSERSFKTPEWDAELFESDQACAIIRKRSEQYTRTFYSKNYFKMSGWDGFVYPFAINLKDIQPKTGRVHLPPSSHLTFSGGGFAVMSFLPRLLDFDEQAIPCPFYHSSVHCDELLLYVSGNFTSRKGIDKGSISYHPSGIPHGPHPGMYEKSIGAKSTDEQAVMVDTFSPLHLTQEGEALEAPDYPNSWREDAS
ncbi:MAG: homogentisate 1,2-dioxygenase [Candidatus Nitrohelix vancouverensis]|uniref:Homogentisate 1,2-dioxygenase n=1 Tax=Candidatus Nitrohelix vancouverensis TaxID=2705534 RepID=A0A7T0C0M6_9BACT|nr:MAG: homogentisate 1,2-dioxygenase [Candidatus Nitrohelix vancouverensis]